MVPPCNEDEQIQMGMGYSGGVSIATQGQEYQMKIIW